MIILMKIKRCFKHEKGSLTVECLLFLIPVMMAFFTLVNISRFVQAEVIINHAITQTAKQISVYSYVLTKTDISTRIQATAKKSEKFKTDTENTISSVTDFMGSVGGLGDGGDLYSQVNDVVSKGQTAYDSVTAYFSDPEELLTGVLAVAKSGGEQMVLSYVAGCIARGGIRDSLGYMTEDPDQYLKGLGIVDGMEGLDFSDSKWMSNGDGKPNIEITVTYTMCNLMFPQFDFGRHQYRVCASTSIW